MSDIEISELSKSFEDLKVLDRIQIKIQSGEFLSMIGPSGCGKSTLLRLLAGLDAPSSGFISISKDAKISFVFQEAHLLPWLTVAENIQLPITLARKSLDSKSLESLLDLTSLREFKDFYPNQLSGGMKMRVSLARALIESPDVLLLDEPFAALDEWTRQRLDEDLRKLWALKKFTVIFVTHSIHEATFLSNRAIVFSKRPGRILIDRKLDLEPERNLQTKTSPSYMSEMQRLYSALEAGSR